MPILNFRFRQSRNPIRLHVQHMVRLLGAKPNSTEHFVGMPNEPRLVVA